MSGIAPSAISLKGAGALLLLIACVTQDSGRASAAELALRIAPMAHRAAPAPASEQHESLYEQFLRWRRTLFH
jgi:hypothetical protein